MENVETRQQLHKAPGIASSCSDKELSSGSLLLTGRLWQPACHAPAQERAEGRSVQHAQTTYLFSKEKQ